MLEKETTRAGLEMNKMHLGKILRCIVLSRKKLSIKTILTQYIQK